MINYIKLQWKLYLKNIELVDRVLGHYIIRCIYIADAVSDKVVLHEAVDYKWVKKEELKELTMFKKHPELLEKF